MKYITCLFIIAACAFTNVVYAQFGPAKGGCLLTDGRQLAGTTRLIMATAQAPATLVYYEKSQPEEFSPDQVRSCQIGKRQFITAGNFVAPDDNGGVNVDHDFVEVIDTAGQIQVFAYTYEQYVANKSSGGVPMYIPSAGMPSGGMMVGGGGGGPRYRQHTVYLLRASGSRGFTPYFLETKEGSFFNKKQVDTNADQLTINNLFTDDPTLQQEMAAGKISEKELPAIVAAYNKGLKRKARP